MLAYLRTQTGRVVPARFKVRQPCPPAALAEPDDRVSPAWIGFGAFVLLVTGAADALSLENVFGHCFALIYLTALVLLGAAAVLSTCVLTLGYVLRTWGVVVILLASSAIVLKQQQALLPVAFYMALGYKEYKRGRRLIRDGRAYDVSP